MHTLPGGCHPTLTQPQGEGEPSRAPESYLGTSPPTTLNPPYIWHIEKCPQVRAQLTEKVKVCLFERLAPNLHSLWIWYISWKKEVVILITLRIGMTLSWISQAEPFSLTKIRLSESGREESQRRSCENRSRAQSDVALGPGVWATSGGWKRWGNGFSAKARRNPVLPTHCRPLTSGYVRQ